MLSNKSPKVLEAIRENGYDVSQDADRRGRLTVCVRDPKRDVEECVGISPANEGEVFTRFALEYAAPEDVERLYPQYASLNLLMDLVA